MRELYAERKAAGICTKCGKEKAEQGRTMCRKCLDAKSEYERENKVYFKQLGICTRCRKNRAMKGRTTCIECTEKDRARSIYMRYKDADVNNKRRRNQWAERLSAGVCPVCGKRKLAPNRKKCFICLEYCRRKKRERKYGA